MHDRALPASQTDFIAQEITQSGDHMQWARDCKGHRVVVRLLQWTAREPWTALLIYKLTDDMHDLCRHKFGRHVAVALFAETPAGYRKRVRDSLCGDVLRCATHPVASTVIAVLLRMGDTTIAEALRAESVAAHGEAWRPLLALSLDAHSRVVADAALSRTFHLFGEHPLPGRAAPDAWKEQYPWLWVALSVLSSADRVRL